MQHAEEWGTAESRLSSLLVLPATQNVMQRSALPLLAEHRTKQNKKKKSLSCRRFSRPPSRDFNQETIGPLANWICPLLPCRHARTIPRICACSIAYKSSAPARPLRLFLSRICPRRRIRGSFHLILCPPLENSKPPPVADLLLVSHRQRVNEVLPWQLPFHYSSTAVNNGTVKESRGGALPEKDLMERNHSLWPPSVIKCFFITLCVLWCFYSLHTGGTGQRQNHRLSDWNTADKKKCTRSNCITPASASSHFERESKIWIFTF